MSSSKKKFIFTITPGHTGSASLAEMLNRNLPDSEIHHEILGYDKFGVDTPDVSHMTLFNSQGNIEKVKSFWAQKIERIISSPKETYGEMSHMLAKAGLMENMSPLLKHGDVYMINLRRDVEKVVITLRKRFDFLNKGNMWLWHLDPNYPRKLVNPSHFLKLGVEGARFWYVCEMYTRAEYYKKLFARNDKVHFIDFDIADLSSKEKTQELLSQLNYDVAVGDIVIPEVINSSKGIVDKREKTRIRNMVSAANFNAESIADVAISNYGSKSIWTL